ncbi:TPA: carbohydrate binding domain-containing protein [Escherichia coli]|nr:hypothetical protein [Escherichia coli]HAY3976951.1 hypothetical protein [Escherichia coli]HBB9210922.1 carbohydrate binding domain-containing protein [Escherichia coli]
MLETTNYKLKKIELNDSPPNIEVINPNWDTIDTELKKAADLKVQYDALKVGAVNLKNFTDFNKISVLDDTTEWFKSGTGTITVQDGVNIPSFGNGLKTAKIVNASNTQTFLSSGYTKGYTLLAKPNTSYTLNFYAKVSNVVGNGFFPQLIERKLDNSWIGSSTLTKVTGDSEWVKYRFKIDTSSDAVFLEMRFYLEGTGSVWIYQPMLVEGNKIVEGWSPSLADIDREIKAFQANIDNMKIGVRNLVWNTDFDNIWSNVNNLATSLVKTDEGQKLTWLLEKKESAVAEILTSKLKGGKEYTLSFEARGNLATLITYILREKGATNNFYVFGGTGLLNTTSFTRITRTFKYVEGDKPSEKLFLGGTSTNADEWLEIKKDSVMLVEGNKAPEDWIHAPEDVKYDAVGVRNLLPNGDFTKGFRNWSFGGTGGAIIEVLKGSATNQPTTYLSTSKSTFSNNYIRVGTIKKGDLVTVSFMARQSGSGALFQGSFHITDGTVSNPISNNTSFSLTSSWKPYVFTFVAKTDGNDTHRLYIYSSGDDTKLLQITDIKVELGSHPTGYIPSTEDINEVIALKENGGLIGTVNIAYGGSGLDVIETSKPYMRFNTNSNGVKGAILESTTFRPNSSGENSLNLGSVSLPWEMVYGKNLNLNGTLTTDTTNAGIDHLKTTKNILCLSGKVGSTVIDDTCFRPLASLKGVYDLGDLAYPWNIIYGNILKLGGTLELKSLSSTVDTINTSKGYLGLNAGDKGVVIDEVANALRPSSTSLGSMSLGTAAFAFKDLFIGSYSPSLSNGYTRLPNGNIMQWGEITCKAKVGTEYTTPITFPIAFPNKPYSIIAVAKYNSRVGGTAGIGSVIVNARSTMANKTGADIITGAINSAGLSTVDNDILVGWISIGH